MECPVQSNRPATARSSRRFHRSFNPPASDIVGRRVGPSAALTLALRGGGSAPFPVLDFRQVVADAADVLVVFEQPLLQRLLQVADLRTQLRQAVEHITGEVE